MIRPLFLLLLVCLAAGQRPIRAQEAPIEWFDSAKLGIFVHWGVYSLYGGDYPGVANGHEFIQLQGQIPNAEYAQKAATFRPDRFDADRWAEAAVRAGAKYIVYTTKHHEGFAMYRSAVDPYNICNVAGVAFDPLERLAEACRKRGLKLGLYYSLGRDWHDPDVPTAWPEKGGRSNTWDFPDEDAKDLNRYLVRKAVPQITELMLRYRPDMMWFDTPELLTEAQSTSILELIRRIAPNCLVNNRINGAKGREMADFYTLEQKGADSIQPPHWETCVTLGKHWGYNRRDEPKTSAQAIWLLVDAVSKGGNMLLNVGPTPQGEFPAWATARLDSLGSWLAVNQAAIRGAQPWRAYGQGSSIRYTTQNGILYLIVRGKGAVEAQALGRKLFGPIGSVRLLGTSDRVVWKQTPSHLSVVLPAEELTYVFAIQK